LRIAAHAEDPFDKLLATGLTVLLGFQSFIIIGGVTRVLPLTGVALPFVSYGGSSLVASYILLALLVRVSDESSRKLAERAEAMVPA
jgi:peptidoglycan glycosyltransferase